MILTRAHSTIMENRAAFSEQFQRSGKHSLEPLHRVTRSMSRLKCGASTSQAPRSKEKTEATKYQTSKCSSLRTNITAGRTNRSMPSTPIILPAGLAKPSRAAPQKDKLPKIGDFSDGNTFFPSVIFGEQEKVGLSKIGRADKEIKMWEQILVEHKREQPSLVSVVEENLRDAKGRRAAIDETLEENHRVGDIDPAATAIKARLEALQWALDTSKFGPEAANIRCVMEGYRTGAITYSTKYTLVWAAKIVGTASHYNDFTADRAGHLDRYFETYGPGWFFYEAPLKMIPSIKPKMGASVALKRSNTLFALESYYVTQGFWKQANFVSRLGVSTLGPHQLAPEDPYFSRDAQGNVNCGIPGPKLSFRSMLDSGATYPTLHAEDLMALGIDTAWYAAQTVQTMDTANGILTTRIYEMFVCVLDDQGRQLVDPRDAVWPYSHKYLGGLCPVAMSPVAMRYDENGIANPFRLSGMFPFLACYMSSTPGRSTLYLGEDRNDVLGSHRMPGQKKWVIQMDPIEPTTLPYDRYGNPHITFTHRDGRIVDRDRVDKLHASTITFLPGTAEEEVIQNDPGNAQFEARFRAAIEAELAMHGPNGEDLEVVPAPVQTINPSVIGNMGQQGP